MVQMMYSSCVLFSDAVIYYIQDKFLFSCKDYLEQTCIFTVLNSVSFGSYHDYKLRM